MQPRTLFIDYDRQTTVTPEPNRIARANLEHRPLSVVDLPHLPDELFYLLGYMRFQLHAFVLRCLVASCARLWMFREGRNAMAIALILTVLILLPNLHFTPESHHALLPMPLTLTSFATSPTTARNISL